MSKCEHGKRKNRCRECGGSDFCEHGKEKYYCKDCGGAGICEHDKRKEYCVICGGNALCEHGKRKSRCIICGGSALCKEHGIEKSRCFDCGGVEMCKHKMRKIYCKECDGSSLCEHGRRKYQCLDCGGSSYCEHNKRVHSCVDCGGSALCEHGKDKRYCKECDGSMFCKHNKQKYRCKECDGRSLCKSAWCEVRGIKKYNGYCLHCCINICPEIKVSNNYKTKETDVVDNLKELFPSYTWIWDKKIKDGCSKRRPDLLLDLGSHVVIVEVDENKHNDYDCSCEHKRLMEISQDLDHRPVVFIRFNPDNYILNGKNITSCWGTNGNGTLVIKKSKQKEWKQRIHTLKEQIEYWVENPSEKTVEIVELFY
jgi:hypothetical protein